MSNFPRPPEDLDLSPDIMDLVNAGIQSGDLQLYNLTCEACGHVERRLESRTKGLPTVYCPNQKHAGERFALRRTVAGW